MDCAGAEMVPGGRQSYIATYSGALSRKQCSVDQDLLSQTPTRTQFVGTPYLSNQATGAVSNPQRMPHINTGISSGPSSTVCPYQCGTIQGNSSHQQ